MKDSTLKRRKRQALYALYKKGLEEGKFTSMRDAGRYLCRQPAPCFYISPERASILVGRLIAGNPIDDLHKTQQRMVHKLFMMYKDFLCEHPDTTLSRVSIMNILVDGPAPEFYMTAGAIRKTLREEIRETKKKYGWGE